MKEKNINKYFADYGFIEEILVSYKIGKITLDETKIILKRILKIK
jgi:hypothetical protein